MKFWAILSTTLLGLLLVFTAACVVLPMPEWFSPGPREYFKPGYDFNLRMNELNCLRQGVNPFDVWHGDVDYPPFYSMDRPELADASHSKALNAYTPWGYVYMLPLALLSTQSAWHVYLAASVICLILIFVFGWHLGKSIQNDTSAALLFASLPILMVIYPIWSNFGVGNLALPILAAICVMIWALQNNHDLLAGFCWALAMVKPQNVLLIAVPLLIKRKFGVCLIAGTVCLVATLLPAWMCHTSPLTLILQAPAAGVGGFFGCGIYPHFLVGTFPVQMEILLATLLGLIICIWATWKLRSEAHWLLLLFPAILCSLSWTYITSYSYTLSWLLVAAWIAWILQNGLTPRTITFGILLALLIPRYMTAYNGLGSALLQLNLPILEKDTFYSIENINTFLLLLVGLPLVFAIKKDRVEHRGLA